MKFYDDVLCFSHDRILIESLVTFIVFSVNSRKDLWVFLELSLICAPLWRFTFFHCSGWFSPILMAFLSGGCHRSFCGPFMTLPVCHVFTWHGPPTFFVFQSRNASGPNIPTLPWIGVWLDSSDRTPYVSLAPPVCPSASFPFLSARRSFYNVQNQKIQAEIVSLAFGHVLRWSPHCLPNIPVSLKPGTQPCFAPTPKTLTPPQVCKFVSFSLGHRWKSKYLSETRAEEQAGSPQRRWHQWKWWEGSSRDNSLEIDSRQIYRETELNSRKTQRKRNWIEYWNRIEFKWIYRINFIPNWGSEGEIQLNLSSKTNWI